MIDEAHLTNLKLSEVSFGQNVVASTFLMLNYKLPPVTRIVLEGVENVPRDGMAIFALNHTDRYNYWPFQYEMWRHGGLPYTTTWVKGRYYDNAALSWFFDQCNNIPLPSRGYLILKDALGVLDRKLGGDEYRLLRDLLDGRVEQNDLDDSIPAGVARLLTTPRRDFQPSAETYASFIQRWNDHLMSLVERRTHEALFEKHNNLIVFPQGTRSLRLLPGKPGLAQFALRYEVPVVPVGSMGSEEAYPSGNPWAGGGTCRYRIGAPLTLDDALADCRIDKPYVPFTREAEEHAETFERAMRCITEAIDDLLDEPYKLDPEGADARSHADRLI